MLIDLRIFLRAVAARCFFSICAFAHNFNVAELKQALAKAYQSLDSNVEAPSQISSQVKEIFGGIKGGGNNGLISIQGPEDKQQSNVSEINYGKGSAPWHDSFSGNWLS